MVIMKNKFDIYDFDIVCDIDAEYDFKYNADTFIEHIKKKYKQEIVDADDMPFVYIGMCLALIKRKIQMPTEMKHIMPKLMSDKYFIQRLNENEEYFKSFKKWKLKFLKLIKKNYYGKEENEEYISPFINWRKNDIYRVDITEMPDNNRFVFLKVVGVKEERGKYYPYVYLFLMPNFSKEFALKDIEKIKYLPVSTRFKKNNLYDYVYEIVDDYLKTNLKKDIQYVGNIELKSPKDLMDIMETKFHARMSLENINSKVKIGLNILDAK